jgi:general secretion pathway protein G
MRKGPALRSPLRRGGGGFTLLEVLIAVVIIAVLMSAVFALLHFVDSARISATETRVHTIGIEVGMHLRSKGVLPAKLEDLSPKPLDLPHCMNGGKFVDNWDRPIQYSVAGQEFKVWSMGPDGVSGTADDIRYKNR